MEVKSSIQFYNSKLDAVLALDISDHLASKYLFWDKNQSMVSLVVSNIDLKCPMLACYG